MSCRAGNPPPPAACRQRAAARSAQHAVAARHLMPPSSAAQHGARSPACASGVCQQFMRQSLKISPQLGEGARERVERADARAITAPGWDQSMRGLGLVDLVGVGHALGRLGLAAGMPPQAASSSACTTSCPPSAASRSCRVPVVSSGAMGSAFHEQHVAGVQPSVHLHDGDAGLSVARLDGAVDRRGPAPARQQRGVDVQAALAGARPAPTAAGSAHRRPPPSHRRQRQQMAARHWLRPAGTCRPAAGCAAGRRQCRCSRANCLTGEACNFMPRPAGRSGWVNTRGM
jgi:hypothetical protein